MDYIKLKKAKSQESDHRLGIVSNIASWQASNSDECPSIEELAEVAGHGPKTDKQKHILDHIVRCDSCYLVWIAIFRKNSTTPQSKKSKIIKLFSTSPYLGWTGTALAIAASVMFFFAIPLNQLNKGDIAKSFSEIRQIPTDNEYSYKSNEKHNIASWHTETVVSLNREQGLPEGVFNKEPLSITNTVKKDHKKDGGMYSIETFSELKESTLSVCSSIKSGSTSMLNETPFKQLKFEAEKLLAIPGNLTDEEYRKIKLMMSYIDHHYESEKERCNALEKLCSAP